MSRKSYGKELRDLRRTLEKQGWTTQIHGHGWKLIAPDGQHMVHASKTPSDPRAFKNTIALCRRYGAKL